MKIKRLKRKRAVTSLILLTLVLGIIGCVKVVFQPVHGQADTADAALAAQVIHGAKHTKQANASTPITASNRYYDLHLPAGFRAQPIPATPPGLLYQQNIVKASEFGSQVISIGVRALPDGGIAGDSSYNMRAQQTAKYRIVNQVKDTDQLAIATDTINGGVVAFWPHAGYEATISVSSVLQSGGESGELRATLGQLLAAWQWQ